MVEDPEQPGEDFADWIRQQSLPRLPVELAEGEIAGLPGIDLDGLGPTVPISADKISEPVAALLRAALEAEGADGVPVAIEITGLPTEKELKRLAREKLGIEPPGEEDEAEPEPVQDREPDPESAEEPATEQPETSGEREAPAEPQAERSEATPLGPLKAQIAQQARTINELIRYLQKEGKTEPPDPFASTELDSLRREVRQLRAFVSGLANARGTAGIQVHYGPEGLFVDGSGISVGDERQLIDGMEVEWGKVENDWSTGNTVTLLPCKNDVDGTLLAGRDPVTAYAVNPLTKAIIYAEIKEGDILPYIPSGTANEGLLINPIHGGTATSVDDILPVGADFELEAAQTDTWDRASQGATDGLTIRLCTRVAYDDTSDETLYAFYRQFKFDSAGQLATISAETRVTVDVPVDCP